MRILKSILLIVFMLISINSKVFSAQKVIEAKKVVSLGEQLETQMWKYLKANDIENIEKMIAKGFQSIHEFGANNRAEELELIKKLDLGKYKLTNFKVSQNGPVIVVTYFVSVEETIKGKRLTKEPAPRLSVFLKTPEGWKWISHANLKSPSK
jgi:hypothetical protein